VVLRVLDQASKPDCTIGAWVNVFSWTPGLSGRVLRHRQLRDFGLSRPVTSVATRPAVVGLKWTRLLVFGDFFSEMQQKMRGIVAGERQRYWKASVAGAIVARELAQRTRAGDPEDDMAAGLCAI